MNKDLSSYFESEEFKELLSKYEQDKQHNQNSYFDSDQLADISEYYTAKGKYQEAHECIDYALQLHPGNTEAMVIKAHLFIENNNLEEANKIAGSIQDISDYEVVLLKAELLLIEKNEDEAELLLRNYAAIEGKNRDSYVDIAYLFLDNSFPEKARAWFEEAISLYPGDSEIMEGLAETYFEANLPYEAIKYYNLLLDEDPYSVNYWAELGKIYFTVEEYDKAIEAYEFVSAIDRENIHSILMLGHCYAKLENYPKAEEYYKEFSSKENNSGNDHSYYYLGICYASMGEYQKAIDSFLKGIDIDGELLFQPLDIYFYVSDCYAELGNEEKAIYYINLAINEDSKYIDTYFSKIKLLLRFGELQEALKTIDEVIVLLPPHDVPNILEAGIMFMKFQKYDSAISTFNLLKDTFPLAFHIFTAFIHNMEGDSKTYHEHIQKALKLSPEGFWEKLDSNLVEKDGIDLMKNTLLEIYENRNY